MNDHVIKLTVEGLESEGGHVRLEDFLKWLDLNSKALAGFDRIVSKGPRATYFRIIELSHGSPATVTVEPRAKDPSNDLRGALVQRYNGAIREIQEGHVPTGLGVDLLRNLRNMADPVGRSVRSARIVVDKGKGIDLTERFARTIDDALKEVECGEGTIEGIVERFNSHKGANVFYVYPDVGPSKVACKFPDGMIKDAAEAVTKAVRVYGTLAYLRGADFPHEIKVARIEVYDPEEELPQLDDITGLAPDATGTASSEDFVAAERDEWDD